MSLRQYVPAVTAQSLRELNRCGVTALTVARSLFGDVRNAVSLDENINARSAGSRGRKDGERGYQL